MHTIEITVLIAVVGCFVGLAGWLSGRDKKISGESKWRGSVDAKLDAIMGIKPVSYTHLTRGRHTT